MVSESRSGALAEPVSDAQLHLEHTLDRRANGARRRKALDLAALTRSIIVLGALSACSSNDATTKLEGFSSDGLQRVHDTMAAHVERGALPGMVTLLSRHGQVHVDPIGLASVDGPAMRRDSIFRIASMTKPITAVAALILIEEGKLRLEESVEALLPELANRTVLARIEGSLEETVPAQRSITVSDLMTFTMGFGIVFPFDTYPIQKAATDLKIGYGPPEPKATPEPDEWMSRLGTLPLMFQPGERWTYNTGSDVLGVLIARAAGQPFETFLRERIFQPLGMKDTEFSVPASKLDRLTASYLGNPATGGLDPFDGVQDSAWAAPPAFPSGAGGLVSTVDDFLLFAKMLLNGGKHDGRQILSTQSVESMLTDKLTPEQKVDDFFPGFWATRGWGYGVAVVTHPDAVSPEPGRYGWDGGLGTYWFSDPAKDFVGILLTQRALDETSPSIDFWPAVYEAMTQ